MARKPGVLQCWQTRLATTQRARKSDDMERNAFGVRKSELILALVLEAVALVCYRIQAPGAKPVPVGISHSYRCPGVQHWVINRWHYQLSSHCGLSIQN